MFHINSWKTRWVFNNLLLKESGEEAGVNTSVDETAAPRGDDEEEKREEGEEQVILFHFQQHY